MAYYSYPLTELRTSLNESQKKRKKKPLIVEVKRQEENTELFVNKTTVPSQASFLVFFALCKVLMSALQVHKSLN